MEKWIRVRAASQIVVGGTYKVVACRFCGNDHIQIVTGYARFETYTKYGRVDFWKVAPRKPCPTGAIDGANGTGFAIALAEGRLFRLDTGLDDSESVAEGRKFYSRQPEKVR